MIDIKIGDCREVLKTLADKSVNCCITSPPYYGLRDYGEDNQIGLESSPQDYVNALVDVFREVKRVLSDDGTLWLNLGDTYSANRWTKKDEDKTEAQPMNNMKDDWRTLAPKKDTGLPDKNLIGIPWKVAFALQEDGWILRQDIIWSKPNPMPESVRDRCTKSHEYIFLFSKNPQYFFDNEAIKEEAKDKDKVYMPYKSGKNISEQKFNETKTGKTTIVVGDKVNRRSVWSITVKSFKDAHFATYPPDLIEPCVLAGCPEKVCKECGKPYVRKVEKGDYNKEHQKSCGGNVDGQYTGTSTKDYESARAQDASETKKRILESLRETIDLGFHKNCNCKTDDYKSGVVLDPFGGAGTTGLVADRLGRDAILIELNKDYAHIADDRLHNDAPLFTNVKVEE
jgi:DNA modification methylase